MARVRSLIELQDALDKEMSWRIKEIGTFQVGSNSSGSDRRPLIRAGVALLYAHWEGFIKSAVEFYLEYVESRGHRYAELKTCFCVFGLKGKLEALVDAKKSEPNIAAFDFILSEMESPAKLRIASAIRTTSNLTSNVFQNIARSIDIEVSPYATKFHLIDESLVYRRNRIAHGEFLDIDSKDFRDLVEEVVGLMRAFKTDLQNAASTASYKRIAVSNEAG